MTSHPRWFRADLTLLLVLAAAFPLRVYVAAMAPNLPDEIELAIPLVESISLSPDDATLFPAVILTGRVVAEARRWRIPARSVAVGAIAYSLWLVCSGSSVSEPGKAALPLRDTILVSVRSLR